MALPLLLSVLITFTSQAAQPANVRMHCWSLRFNRPSAVGSGGGLWHLGLTTISSSLNGELAPDPFGTGFSHSSDVDLYDELTTLGYDGFLALDVPEGGDANGNGFPDFFEVSQPVDGLVTSGNLELYGGGAYDVQATWSRSAESGYGTCLIPMPDPFNPFVTLNFYFTFQLTEYGGVLAYTPGATNVMGTLSVTNNDTEDHLIGPVEFEKSTADPFNEVNLQSALLTNSSLGILSLYASTTIYRDGIFPTNYFGDVEFQDGDLNTVEEDYYSWQISIDDTNDADMDGIPDFSDDPTVAPPAAPTLSMALGTTNVWITISSEVGHLLEIQSAGTPLATNWTTVHSVTLTNNPQTEFLPQPVATTFWRARIPAGQ